MSDITDAMGTAVEGGLFARVLGRKGSKDIAKPVDESGSTCLNCGTELTGEFCHACGQKAHIHRTISAIMHDLIHGVLHLDGKLWRTLPLLAFKPGRLTREYIEGKRARYVSPMAMFLFSVFLMFAIFQALGLSTPTDFNPSVNVGAAADNLKSQAEARAEELQKQANELPEGDPRRVEIEANLETLNKGLSGAEMIAEATAEEEDGAEFNLTGIEAFDEGIIKKWRENPSLMLYKLQNNAYKFSWALIPLSVPFVWLLFAFRRRFRAYDHAIFVTYSLGFMSLLFIALSLLGVAGAPVPALVLAGVLIPPAHLYKHLRRTYELSRLGTLWRLFALMIFILIIIVLFLQLLLVLGAF